MNSSNNIDKNYIAAIDIGGSKVVVAVAEVTDGGDVRIVAANSTTTDGESVRNGEVRNVINLQSNIRKCLDTIKEEEGFIVDKAVVNLSGAHIQCVDFEYTINIRDKSKQVTQADLDSLYQEARNRYTDDNFHIVEVIPQAYYVDGERVMTPLGSIGKKIKGEYCIIGCDKQSKAMFDDVFKNLNLTPVEYTLSSLASAEAVLMEEEREYGVAMIDIGSDCSDIVVFKNNIPCDVGVVPLGGRNINDDIASLNVLPKYVESIKQNYARALAENSDYYEVISLPIKSDNINKRVVVRELCGVVEARVREIAEEIMHFLQEGGQFHGLGAGIVLTGGTAKLKDIEDLFRDVTGYDNVTVRYPNVAGLEENEILNDPEYATVAGLLLNGGYWAAQPLYRNMVRVVGVNHEPQPERQREQARPVEPISTQKQRERFEERGFGKKRGKAKETVEEVHPTLFTEEEADNDIDDLFEDMEKEEPEVKATPRRSLWDFFKEPKDNVDE